MKNKEMWLIASVVFIVGLLVGLVVGDVKNSKPVQVAVPQNMAAPAAVNNTTELLEKIVAEQPDNLNAWVQLAHDHFDANRPMEAVKAYSKALALRPEDADLLTDQGVMYRRLGWYDQAVKNFTSAAEVDGTHIQGLYNLGIVYLYDLGDKESARQAWNRYLQRNPGGAGSDQVREQLDQIRESFDTRLPQ
ncbi:MAG: tetratricopeptide repeat protein [Desulfuromonas sp.]|nr:tetratricopeptide repeat protein [Desulfuromonas sp.]